MCFPALNELNFEWYPCETSNPSTSLSRKFFYAPNRWRDVVFAYHIVYILALGTHIHNLKATKTTRDNESGRDLITPTAQSQPLPHSNRTKSPRARTSDIPFLTTLSSFSRISPNSFTGDERMHRQCVYVLPLSLARGIRPFSQPSRINDEIRYKTGSGKEVIVSLALVIICSGLITPFVSVTKKKRLLTEALFW